VATGKIVSPSLGPTRTEANFASHIERTIATDPNAGWIFVSDQLNTHQSKSLVQLVARLCHIPESELGKKGKTGILATRASRREFLENPTHRTWFVFTPNYSSWLNQTIIWFSILMQRLLHRASFASIAELENFHRLFQQSPGKTF
jgi:hypothetical protein